MFEIGASVQTVKRNMLKHVRAIWCNLSVISGNLSVLVLLWEAEGHPYEAITIPYKSANHLQNLHAARLLGAKWPTTNQIMQQISTTERNLRLRLTWYAHCMLFKHSMDSMDVGHDYRVHGCNGSILLNHKPQPFHSSLLDLLGALEPTLHNTFAGDSSGLHS